MRLNAARFTPLSYAGMLGRMLRTIWILLLLATAPAFAGEWVWWEGESPVETNFPARSWFSADTFEAKRHEVLSGGDWLSNSGKRSGPEAFARYRVRVASAGTYDLWARKFWKHGPFRWRFDRSDWRECGREVGLADSVPIRTHLVANWAHLGRVELTSGARAFELRLLASKGQELTACFDCFLLTAAPFVPRGRLKPGEKSGLTEPGWWPLEPAPDTFGKSKLDLRGLNEDAAGQSGFVRRDGDRLLLGDGKPVKFWAVNCGPGIVNLGSGSVDYLAKRLAKSGVNLVRFHGPVFNRSAKDPTRVDEVFLAKLHTFVAACKREGIYTLISFYFPLWFDVRPGYGLPGYEGIENKKPFSLIYFDPRMQEIYNAWAYRLFTAVNPHTGLPLGKDPAVAMVELVNEDSLLFWTFKPGETIPWERMEILEGRYFDWLVRRYRTAEGAYRAWKGGKAPRDDPGSRRMGLYPIWDLTGKGLGAGPHRARAADQLEFLLEVQRGFYERTIKLFREKLGIRCPISCCNWKTADPRLLDGRERYTYTAGDVIDQHGYFGGRHQGQGANYSVRTGHTFADRAGVLSPGALPIRAAQVEGYPHMISEIGWTNPNRLRADSPVICAAYGAMQGIDALCLFAVNGPGWSFDSPKFPVSIPTVLGQFPACALMYRRGDVAEAEVVVSLSGPGLSASPEPDPNRPEDRPAQGGGDAIDPLAFYAGRVVRTLQSTGKPHVRDLKTLIDVAGKRVRSATGELLFDHGRGLVTIDTKCCQGAAGYLGATGPIKLGDVTIECGNEYAAVLVISLDGEPIASSRSVLIQCVTEERPYGYRTEGDRITDLGGYPLLLRNADLTVTVRGKVRAATTLDAHGHGDKRTKPILRRADSLVVKFPPDAIYVVLE